MEAESSKEGSTVIFYTRYPRSGLATVVSFIGSAFICVGLATTIMAILNGEDAGEAIIVAVVAAAMGAPLLPLAKYIARKKDEKLSRRAAQSAPQAQAQQAPKPAPQPQPQKAPEPVRSAPGGSAESYRAIAQKALDEGRFADAVEPLNKALALESNNAALWSMLGRAHRNMGNTAYAAQMYQKAIDLDPGEGIYRCNLGAAYLAGGSPDKALLTYQEGLSMMKDTTGSDYAVCQAGYAMSLARCGFIPDAEKALATAESLGYRNGDAVRDAIRAAKK